MSGTITERGGIASVQIDGTIVTVGAEISIKLGGEVRTAKMASTGVAGWTSKFQPPEISLTAIDGPATSILALKAVSGQTMQVVLNNGKSYLLTQAFQVDDPTAKIAEGDIDSLKFQGVACTEILA